MDQEPTEMVFAAGVIAKRRQAASSWSGAPTPGNGHFLEEGSKTAKTLPKLLIASFGKRLKMDKAHDVPLSDQALDILRRRARQ